MGEIAEFVWKAVGASCGLSIICFVVTLTYYGCRNLARKFNEYTGNNEYHG